MPRAAVPALVASDGVTDLRRAVMPSAPYHAGDPVHRDMASWMPPLLSADASILSNRNLIVARVRDMVRNNGWAAGMVRRYIDAVIGANLRLSASPDYRALGITPEAAVDLADQMETAWRAWASDPLRRCDAARHDTFGLMSGLMFRHKVTDGEDLGVLLWREDRGPFATCLQVVDPDRLSNPNGMADRDTLRGGVELDDDGAAVAYQIRRGHPYDRSLSMGQAMVWDRVERETPWGRPMVIHDFDRDQAGQHRGVSRLASALREAKMTDNYASAELQSAVINAILAAFIESPMDHSLLADVLESPDEISAYQKNRMDFHGGRDITLNGARVAALFPGERFTFQSAARPSQQFEPFTSALKRNMAGSIGGQSYEQATLDWSKSNYSSARGGIVEAAKTVIADRFAFETRTVLPVYLAVMEEAIDRGYVTLPDGAPDLYDAPAAYLRARWIGPGQGWIDPVKEAQAAKVRMDGMLSTLEAEAAAQGLDWQDVIQQRARERAAMEAAGLADPSAADLLGVRPRTDDPETRT